MSVYCDGTDLVYLQNSRVDNDFDSGNFAFCFWFYDSSGSSSANRTLFYPRSWDPSPIAYIKWYLSNRSLSLQNNSGSGSSAGNRPDIGRWVYMVGHNGTTQDEQWWGYYYYGESLPGNEVSIVDYSSGTINRLGLGNDSGSYDDPALGYIANLQIYNGGIDSATLLRQMYYWEPVDDTNLFSWLPLWGNTPYDYFSAETWSENGTPSYGHINPPISLSAANISYFLAVEAPPGTDPVPSACDPTYFASGETGIVVTGTDFGASGGIVELANASDGTGGYVAQTTTSHTSDTSITFTCSDVTGLNTNATVYLFVNQGGNRNAVGLAVTLKAALGASYTTDDLAVRLDNAAGSTITTNDADIHRLLSQAVDSPWSTDELVGV